MSQKLYLIKDNYPPLASVFWEYDFAYGAPHLIVIWFKPVRACSQGSIPGLRVGSFITSPGNTGSHRIGIVSFYSSSFLGKHWPQTRNSSLCPLEKQSWHTPSVFPGAWLVEPSASAAGAVCLGRPWAPSGPASRCPGLLFGLECLAGPFFLSWFFIVICKARKGADPLRTELLFSF